MIDINMLPHINLNVNDAFINEWNFVISRTPNTFSAMGMGQCHEEQTKLVKGDGGAIGFAEDEDRLRKWMVCGHEVARIVTEFKENSV